MDYDKTSTTGIARPSTDDRVGGVGGFTKLLLALTIIGGLNWGLIGFFNWDLVAAIFGGTTSHASSGLSRIIYALVGLSALALVFMLPKLREAHRVVDIRRGTLPPTERRTPA